MLNSWIVFFVPFNRNQSFTGRETELDDLRKRLLTDDCKRVALVGLGGLGKTQIALEMAYSVNEMSMKDSKESFSVLWMPGQSMSAFHKAASDLMQKLNIDCHEGADPKTALLDYLESDRAGRWFLILDNADDPSMLDERSGNLGGLKSYLPQNSEGKMLITTRSSEVAVHMAGNEILRLSTLAPDNACRFVQGLLSMEMQSKETSDIQALCERLQYFPLALAQAADYMNSTGTPVARYLQLCESTEHNLMDLLRPRLGDKTFHDEKQRSIATTWTISFDTIRETDPGALRLLSFIQWIDSKAIPVNILPEVGSALATQNSIGLLCAYGFLSWREDGKTLDMHSLVHMVLRKWLMNVKVDVISEDDVLEQLNRSFPPRRWIHRTLWRQYLPHVIPLVHDPGLQSNPKTLKLSRKVLYCLQTDGRSTETVAFLERVAAICNATLPEHDIDRLNTQKSLGMAYHDVGKTERAIETLKGVMAIQKKVLPETHPSRLEAQYLLGTSFDANAQSALAVELLEPVVAVREKEWEARDVRLIDSQQALALAYSNNGQSAKALEVFEKIVHKEAMIMAPVDNPLRTNIQFGLGDLSLVFGQVEKAIEILEEVVSVTKTLSQAHPSRLRAERALAYAYQRGGRPRESIDILERMTDKETIQPNDETPRLLHDLANSYTLAGRTKEAIDILQHLLETQGAETQLRLVRQVSLARAYTRDRQLTKAIDLLEHVVSSRATLEPTDPRLLSSQRTLAEAYTLDKQVDKAIEIWEHILGVQLDATPKTAEDVLWSKYGLAMAHGAKGETDTMVQLLVDILDNVDESSYRRRSLKSHVQNALARSKNSRIHRTFETLLEDPEVKSTGLDDSEMRDTVDGKTRNRMTRLVSRWLK